MRSKVIDLKQYKEYVANVIPAALFGILCGAVVGVCMFFFKFGAQKVTALSEHLYELAATSPLYVALLFAVLVLFALLMIFLHKKMPDAKGGGIPLSEGILRGLLSFNWWKTLIGTALGSMISFFCGLPLGSEGPAVAMGTALGHMCGKITGNKHAFDRYIMTGGAGAGFAVATGAPLSAMLFALEEIHKRFTPMLVLTVSMSVLSATAVNRLLSAFFGVSPYLFEVEKLASFRLSNIGWLVLLGVLTALAVGAFDASIVLFGKMTSKISRFAKRPYKIIFIFLLTGVLGLVFTDALYSGHHTVLEMVEGNKTVFAILLILALRMLLMLLITDSGVTGGIFVPTLAIGALCGALIVKLLVFCGMPEELYAAAVLLSMCAFMGGMLRSPLVSAVLFAEITGQFTDFFYVALVVFVVAFVTELLNQTSFYDSVMERMEHEQTAGKTPKISCFELKVLPGSFVIGKAVRDVMWPPSCVVLSIKRAEKNNADTDHDGEKKLYEGDTVIVRARFYEEDELKKLLLGLVGKNQEISEVEMH